MDWWTLILRCVLFGVVAVALARALSLSFFDDDDDDDEDGGIPVLSWIHGQ
jgi:hypothetical protein